MKEGRKIGTKGGRTIGRPKGRKHGRSQAGTEGNRMTADLWYSALDTECTGVSSFTVARGGPP